MPNHSTTKQFITSMKTVILIDDEEISNFIVKRYLGIFSKDTRVIEFTDAKNAYYSLPFTKPDLIFLDLHMPEFTGWESWANFPEDRNRLLAFIEKHKISGVIFISGDTHWGEVSKVTSDTGYGLWEVTSSGLSEKWKDVSPNKHRVGPFTNQVNYGFITFDWQQTDPTINLGLKNELGEITHQHQLTLSQLQF